MGLIKQLCNQCNLHKMCFYWRNKPLARHYTNQALRVNYDLCQTCTLLLQSQLPVTKKLVRSKLHNSTNRLSPVPSKINEEETIKSRHDNQNRADVSERLSHVPVMSAEVIASLKPRNGQVIVDMTFGAGGHAREMMKTAPDIKYIASDRDPLAFQMAKKFASQYKPGQVIPVLGRFSELPSHLATHGIEPGQVDAFLFDLGASSMQFDTVERGFSLSKDGPLDMRMDGLRNPESATAADVVNSLEVSDLANIIKKYGEEKKANQIANAIVESRYAFGNFTRTKQLAEVVKSVFESGAIRHDKLHRHSHVATKTFQALRIFVNDELNELHSGLLIAAHFLRPGSGICAALSFHSLEDRIIKRHFHGTDLDAAPNQTVRSHFRNAALSFDIDDVRKQFLENKQWEPLSRKVAQPSDEECLSNPRARSAKLRAAVRSCEGR